MTSYSGPPPRPDSVPAVLVDARTAHRFLVTRHLLAPARVYVPAARRRWGYYVLRILGAWREDGFDPRRADGFVDAMKEALTAYLGFAGARRIEWAPHLGRERRLVAQSTVK